MTSSPAGAALVGPPAGNRPLAIVLMTGFVASWAILEAVVGARLRQSYDLMQIVWCRYAAHLIIVFGIWGWRQPSRIWSTKRRTYQIGRSLLMLVMPGSFALALAAGTPVSTVWSVMWLAPAMILVSARVLLGDRPTLLTALAVVAGCLAAPFVLEAARVGPTVGIVYGLLTAASFALYVVMTRVLRHEAVRTNLFYTAVGVFVPLSVYVPGVWIAPDLHDVMVLAGIGAIGFVALFALDRSLERADVSVTASFCHLQVVFVAFIAWRRQPYLVTPYALVGVMLIAGFALLRWREVMQHAKHAREVESRTPAVAGGD